MCAIVQECVWVGSLRCAPLRLEYPSRLVSRFGPWYTVGGEVRQGIWTRGSVHTIIYGNGCRETINRSTVQRRRHLSLLCGCPDQLMPSVPCTRQTSRAKKWPFKPTLMSFLHGTASSLLLDHCDTLELDNYPCPSIATELLRSIGLIISVTFTAANAIPRVRLANLPIRHLRIRNPSNSGFDGRLRTGAEELPKHSQPTLGFFHVVRLRSVDNPWGGNRQQPHRTSASLTDLGDIHQPVF